MAAPGGNKARREHHSKTKQEREEGAAKGRAEVERQRKKRIQKKNKIASASKAPKNKVSQGGTPANNSKVPVILVQ